MKHVRKRLTYANVMSSIAVFLILGGGAAFAALGKNTVGTRQLKKNAVKVGKLGPEAVKAGKLAKNAVATNRLRTNVVTTDKIADSAVATGKILNNSVTGDKVNESTLSEVPNAASLGGTPASSYQKTGDLLFATVAPANAGAAIVRGRGAVSVIRQKAGSYRVVFNRDITGCTWLATYGQPNDSFVDARWATVRGRDVPTQIGVVLRDQNGAEVDGVGFHVAAFCP